MVSSGTDIALTVLGIIGNITSMGLFMSPMPTFYKICKRKTTGEYSGLPYVATVLNCMLWTFYGAPAVAGLIFVVSINVAGLALEGTYVTIHLIFGTPKSRRKITALLTVICVLYGVMVACLLLITKKPQRGVIVGSICVIIGVLMYASPLVVMKEVIRSQSVQSMPFLLSFASFCNSLIWAAYGVIKKDKFIYIPNGLGTLLTLGQLFLWCIYYKKGVRKMAIDSAATQHAIDVLTADKLTKQPSMGTHEVSADHFDLSQIPRKSLNENNTALMALCRDQP